MSLKFGESKLIYDGSMQLIPIKSADDKPVLVKTGKYFSFGLQIREKCNWLSMPLELDQDSVKI